MTAIAQTEALSPASERPFRVLLADAGHHVRERLTGLLEQQAVEVLTADDGFDVLCRLPELRPDLLLLASTLPRLSGTQVCSLLRQCPDFRHLTVILMGDEHTLLDEVRAELAGADGCLQMPFRLAELQDALAQVRQRQPDPVS
ncbi:MAG: response regulator [Pseudohongiella sp.]|uniref:PleD family two-component system response regulator n=1 Tax=Pseudohongiella sp. TaxID=1979412 RepID=UPI0034A01088